MTWLESIIAEITPAQRANVDVVQAHLDDLTKPCGSLGRLEEIALQLALIYGDPPPALSRRHVIVFASDHGVADAGVSAYPQAVTRQMCAVLAEQRAGINVIARACGASVSVIDVGVNVDESMVGIENRRVRRGSRNFAIEPALARDEVELAMQVGFDSVRDRSAGDDIFALGEIGIGNTTTAAAITSALLGLDAKTVCGRGTGIDDAVLQRKMDVVSSAVARLPACPDPLAVLSEIGGLDICALVGALLGAARYERPAVLDGFIASAAAIVAVRLCPAVRDYLFAAHVSCEPGHKLQLAALGLQPLFDLRLRLGEGTGAALALPVLAAAAALLRDMATFTDAGVARQSIV